MAYSTTASLTGQASLLINWYPRHTSVLGSLHLVTPNLVSWKTSFPWTGVGGGGFRMIQVHYIYCALYFYYYYIRSTSDQQALDPRGWETLPQSIF